MRTAVLVIGAGVAWILATVLSGCSAPGVGGSPVTTMMVPDLPLLADGVGRAITWENRTGEPGAGGREAEGRKGSPCIRDVPPGAVQTLMDVKGPGVIRHIWITIPDRGPEMLRNIILRMYWDHEPQPSVEVPLGDFFGVAHGRAVPLVSAWTTLTLGRGFNCFFPMPFETHARITFENDTGRPIQMFFFQIDYELLPSLPPNTGRFHAQFRRQNPTVLKEDYVIVDNVRGPGMYVGTVIGVRSLEAGWWGEGEVKMYMDGDTTHPTICGTGTEDYFCAAWGMDLYQTPYHGCTQNGPDDFCENELVSLYRWHVPDPIRFRRSLKVTVQQIGWGHGKMFERSDDWCSTAFWYQLEPHHPFPALPDRAARLANIFQPPPAEPGASAPAG